MTASGSRWARPASGRPFIMGILNVTPDSFSDGGRFLSTDKALAHAFELIDQGADIIDIGGESTRPGADPVSLEDELQRTIPVIKELSAQTDIPISIDTMKPEVAEKALNAGVSIINDICGLMNEKMEDVVVSYDAEVVIMHMHGTPKTLGTDVMDGDFMSAIKQFLDDRADHVAKRGLDKSKIILDPGVGFGKTSEQNMRIIQNSDWFSKEYPVLIAPSRKRFLSDGFPGMERDAATSEAVRIAVESGASMVRVHNVDSMSTMFGPNNR